MSAAPPARWRPKHEVQCPSPLPPRHGLRAAPALAPGRRNGAVGPALPSAPPEPRFGPLSTDGGRSLRLSAPTPLVGGKRETSELPPPPHPGRLRVEGPFSDAPDCPGPGPAGGDGGRHCFERSSAAGASARRSGRRSLPAAPRRRLWRRPQHGEASACPLVITCAANGLAKAGGLRPRPLSVRAAAMLESGEGAAGLP